MSVVQELFTEKFRPKNLNQLIAPPRIKSLLDKGLVQNLLLYGTQGTGKSSTAFILANPKDDTTMYVNASSEGGVKTVREEIPRFCSAMSLTGGRETLKCVILDEMDGASDEFFKALRGVMEKYAHVARFIATCNFIAKIPLPVQDRFHLVSYDPINQEEEKYLIGEYMKRSAAILDAAKIKYTEDILLKMVKNDFPSLRAVMTKIQSLYLSGVKELNEGNYYINYDYVDLFNLCLAGPDKPYENYKLIVAEYSSRIDDTMSALGIDFVEYLKKEAPAKIEKIPLIIIATAEHQAQRTMVIDPLITLLSLVMKLQMVLGKN